jgi:hypothetical protein
VNTWHCVAIPNQCQGRAYHHPVSGRRLAWIVAAVALAGSQAGHLVSYELRFGSGALQVQAEGAHSYFLSLVRTGLGFAAFAALAALLVIGAGRVAGRRRLVPATAPSLLRVLAALFSLQLACFVVQETAEAVLGGDRLNPAGTLLLWGAAGQLPVALVAAIALRWLLTRFGPALAAIRLRLAPARRPRAFAFALRTWPLAVDPVRVSDSTGFSLSRRGPPPSF